jgi:hypothetical protein
MIARILWPAFVAAAEFPAEADIITYELVDTTASFSLGAGGPAGRFA